MSPVYRQVTDANGDVRLEPMIVPQMELVTLSRRTGKVLKREPYRKSWWGTVIGRSTTGAFLDMSPSVDRHHWMRTKAGTIRCYHCAEPMGTNRFARSVVCGRRFVLKHTIKALRS